MLVRITNRCHMGCSHCLVNASPNGEHMTRATFEQATRFILSSGMPYVLVSGGEPAEHPELVAFLDHLRAQPRMWVSVLSNGVFLHEDPILRDQVLGRVDGVQTTNDSRFYPRFVPAYPHPKVSHETYLRVVSPFGRARAAGLKKNRRSPHCYNLRLLCRPPAGALSIRRSLMMLRTQGQFCTPSINVDGLVVAGEAPECQRIGTVEDSWETLTENLRTSRCNRCGLVNNLTKRELCAITLGWDQPPAAGGVAP